MEQERGVMAKLPKEITEKILSHLPTKSLARFRCVSQSWNSLLSADPYFAKLRFETAPQRAQKLLVSSRCTLNSLHCESFFCGDRNELDFPFKKPDCRVKILGSCNGLVCVASDDLGKGIFLWNPFTGINRKLPNLEIIGDRYCHCYGFGFDSISNDYKIVMITPAYEDWVQEPSSKAKINTHVFSLKANSWKRLSNIPPSDINWVTKTDTGVLFKGALHWVLQDLICAFDISGERFYNISLPGGKLDLYNRGFEDFLGVVKRCLCLTRCCSHIFVLLMENYPVGTSWVLLNELETPNDYPPLCAHTLCATEEGALILVLDDHALVMFDPERKKYYQYKVCDHRNHPFKAILYVENLNSPYIDTED